LLTGSIGLAAQDAAAPAPSSPTGTLTQTSPAATTPETRLPSPQAFGEISGVVKSGNILLPGVTVIAANTLTGKKFITSTESNGGFKITVSGKGRYVVRAEFSAFAPVTQEVVLSDQVRNAKADLSMVLLSRAEKATQQEQQQIAQQMASGNGRPGMQQLALASGRAEAENSGMPSSMDTASLAGAGLPNAGLASESNESVSISGSMGRTEQNPFDPGEMQDRISEVRDQMQQGDNGSIMLSGTGGMGGGGPMVFVMGGGGFGGPGGGGFGGGRGGRGMRGFNVNKPHGSLFYTYDGSALDAKPFSLNGQSVNKADYNQNRFGATIGGPLNIPHLYNGGTKTLIFGNYTGSRSNNPYDVLSTVPTLDERNGIFGSKQVAINPISAQLLAFIPQPNLPGTSKNFHFVSAAPSNTDTMFIRINHSFGADQPGVFGARAIRRQQQQQQGQNQTKDAHWSHNINGGFVFNDIRNTILNPFPGLGGKLNTQNYNANVGYSAVKGLFLNSLRFVYNQSHNQTVNNFTNVNNIEGTLGISGVSSLPADWGLPVLNFAPQFSSLQDLTPAFRNNQTYTISDSMSLTHGKHAWTWGGDFRRLIYGVSNAANARGTFVFTGAASQISPFADFLEGFAQQTSVTFGAENYQFRANSWDLFVQDNWRITKNLTFNLGVRYERVTPYIETGNQLVNLDINPTFTAVAPVLPGQVGPITGTQYPSSLINPSHYDFAPRIGIAWKPFSKTVVRVGYGINYNLAQYGLMATQLGFQPPFAVSQINPAPTTTSLTLQNGFPGSTPTPDRITNTYAVDPNYQLPYVQTWNLNIQQEIKSSIVVNIGYMGSKGTHLDVVGAPDQNPVTGLPIFPSCALASPGAACVSPYLYEFSGGSSFMNAATVRVRKRMRHGLSFGGTYTFSKSIDDASSIGGGGTVVAQNFYDIAAERGLSAFNQTHRFTADYYYELPAGKEKKWLNSDSWAQKLLGGFAWSGNITLASGFPFSPRVFGSSVDLGRGVTGSARPDLVPGQPIQISNPGINEWFNVNAFTASPGPFGNAGRNIIIGPGTISVNMAFSKTIQVKEMQNLELRLSANNVFNHPNFTSIDTTFQSPTFGQVTAAGAMRTAQLTARYRF
jgi:trimeric autotransporter adhesin